MGLRNPPLLIDDIGNPLGVLIARTARRAISETDRLISVGEKRKLEVELLGEAGVVCRAVEADAEDLDILRFVIVGEVPEPGTFGGSAGCICLRVEPEDHFLAAEVGEFPSLSLMIGRLEVRGRIAYIQHRCSSSNDRPPHEPHFSAERHSGYCSSSLVVKNPSLLLVEAVRDLPPGRALDLACGSGRNALYLAERGWDVVAIDRIETVHHPRIEGRRLDLEQGALPFDDESFDLVCIIHFLHRPLFGEARRMTRRGGCVVSAIHTVKSTMNPKYAIALGELRSYFSDWEILIDREDEVAELAARRPQR